MDGGERAVIFDRFDGVKDDVIGEGTHFRIPFIQYPKIMDIRTVPRVIQSTTGTKDLQMVNISLRVLSHPKEDNLPRSTTRSAWTTTTVSCRPSATRF